MVICKAHGTPRNEAYTVRRSDEGDRATQQMAVSQQPPQGRKRSRADSQILYTTASSLSEKRLRKLRL